MANADDEAANAWLERRRALEGGLARSTPDRPVPRRPWHNIDPILHLFGHLLRVVGLYSRGRRNALDIRLNHRPFVFADLPVAFDGYRILQISDPHLDLLPELADNMIGLVAGLKVDLVLLTGDYRNDHSGPVEPGLAMLRPILDSVAASDGLVAILGNHDPAAAAPVLRQMGARVLINETMQLRRGDDVMHLTGLDDVHYFYTEAARTALLADYPGFRIAAVHSAEVADWAAAAGVDLYLCGHTHGGQICLPGGRAPVSHLSRCRNHAQGTWREGNMQGYTSFGAGSATIPVRFHCPPEIALITLARG
ncbi:MAG: metallophosphoesterase [Alphaproteobacteria bacterium]|jgi:hypothetical protein|nr:metallophosphoesterase [Alphaproteobacteria bacterium]MDP6563908.1 metallophosphoesterase [Alphaproteobacteria bacterium]MDP6812394.1 metallophosphoesterase [Alphaproteobacteria bacterium]